MSDKVNFRAKKITRYKETSHHDKRVNPQKDTGILNAYAPDDRTAKYGQQNQRTEGEHG